MLHMHHMFLSDMPQLPPSTQRFLENVGFHISSKLKPNGLVHSFSHSIQKQVNESIFRE